MRVTDYPLRHLQKETLMSNMFITALCAAILTAVQASASITLVDPYECGKNDHLTISFDIVEGKVTRLECLPGSREVNLQVLDGGEIIQKNSDPKWWCEVIDARGDATIILGERQQLVMKAQLARRAAFSVFAQQRLKADLRIVAGRARTVLGVYRCDLAAAKGVNLIKSLAVQRSVAAQRSTPAHLAHMFGWRAHRIDGICHAVLAENFHGALIEIVSLGQDRRASVTFDE